MANFNDQLLRMKSLMTYGAVNEKKETNSGAMEYHAVGADGKSYGIIRENQKFYIKVAPKSKEMVVEAYEYIGGFNNKKANEYTNYSNAMKNFELKLMSINEAYNPKVNIDSLEAFEANGEVMTEGTKEMMAEIARQRQIMNNVAAILNESSTISSKNIGTPEAPKTVKFNDKIGKPFEVTAKAELDGDFKKTAEKPEKQGEPFGDSAKAEKELSDLAVAMAEGAPLTGELEKHAPWAEELKNKYTFTAENALDIILQETGKVFAAVLEDAGVYKNTPQGKAAFARFADYVNQ